MNASGLEYLWPSEPPETVVCPVCGHVSDEEPLFMNHFQHVASSHPSHWRAVVEALGAR